MSRSLWPALAALPLLTAAALLALVYTPRWQDEAGTARRALPTVHRAAAAPAIEASVVRFPVAGDPDSRVADLLALALHHGVTVARVQQRLDGAGDVRRLQLGLAARGRYGDLRGFIGEALRTDPALALDRLTLRRASPAAQDVDADLQWSLLQSGPGPDLR